MSFIWQRQQSIKSRRDCWRDLIHGLEILSYVKITELKNLLQLQMDLAGQGNLLLTSRSQEMETQVMALFGIRWHPPRWGRLLVQPGHLRLLINKPSNPNRRAFPQYVLDKEYKED